MFPWNMATVYVKNKDLLKPRARVTVFETLYWRGFDYMFGYQNHEKAVTENTSLSTGFGY